MRHSGKPSRELMQDIRRSAEQIAHSAEVRLYRHVVWSTDLGVHLYLNAHAQDPLLTEFGARLAEALREHGMVAHTVWLEEWSEGSATMRETP